MEHKFRQMTMCSMSPDLLDLLLLSQTTIGTGPLFPGWVNESFTLFSPTSRPGPTVSLTNDPMKYPLAQIKELVSSNSLLRLRRVTQTDSHSVWLSEWESHRVKMYSMTTIMNIHVCVFLALSDSWLCVITGYIIQWWATLTSRWDGLSQYMCGKLFHFI